MLTQPSADSRRGVLLLIVLSVLALFALLALTFVLVAVHYYRSAQTAARAAQASDSPQSDLDDAFHQVLRGTDNSRSALGPHSLLEDMYGTAPAAWAIGVPGTDDDLDGTVDETDGSECVLPADFAAASNAQLYEFTLYDAVPKNGCVLTMLDGPAAGQSTRIVGINPTNGKAQIVAFQGTPPLVGNHYVINGVPFSGTGFGYNPGDGSLNATDASSRLLALLPNDTTVNRNPPGGANEDYDAVDYQNMLLAMVTSSGSVPIPSLHRPELIRYWMSALSCTFGALPAELKQAIVLRPLSDFHPDFDGGNPTFDATWDGVPVAGSTRRWDVDNDGDGQADSIWVDLGAPVRSTPDGRFYKPLYAILCTDMDGRFNLNAHGCLAQTDANYYGNVNVDFTASHLYPYFTPPISGDFAFSSTYNSATSAYEPYIYLPRGLGWGPAEVNLISLFATAADPLTAYSTFLTSRYGTDGVPGLPAALPGFNGDDYLSQNIWSRYGGAYWTFGTPNSGGAYGSPPSAQGAAVLGLSTSGHPIYCAMGVDEQINDPYESNLAKKSSVDSPFTVAELERILRPYDADMTTLPNRLAALAAARNSVTTDSWDVPCPGLSVSKELRDGMADKRLHHLTDLLAAKGLTPVAYPYLLPPEMLSGLRMDINRPFGDGYDSSSPANNVIDEPGEASLDVTLQLDSTGAVIGSIPFSHNHGVDLNGDGLVNTDDETYAEQHDMARQLYARNLYVLALSLIGYPNTSAATMTQANKNLARVVAQWAVNVVDFRDRDSIMTAFEYDVAPFYDDSATADGNPWDVDGNISTTDIADCRGIVWGCERPELLITETFAMHDRRTEDLSFTETSGSTNYKTTDTDPDNDFDQRVKPQGSLFVELYNPNSAMEPLPAELCTGTDGTTTGGAGVDLKKSVIDGSDISPVWRLAIVTRDDAANDPDNPPNSVPFDRTVYFVDPGGNTLPSDGASIQYHASAASAAAIPAIRPGSYAVIGPGEPGEVASDGKSTTYLGYRTTGVHDTTTRRIELNTTAGTVDVFSDGTTNDLAALSLTYVPAAIPVVIDEPLRLCITTTSGGYPAYTSTGGDSYDPPFDLPLDASNPMWNDTDIKLKDNGTYLKVRVIYLQRLANPLLPYNATTNPYLTVDTMPVDLQSFNGITSATDIGENPKSALANIETRQRGERAAGPEDNNIWEQESLKDQDGGYNDDPTNNGPGIAAADHYLNQTFHQTLGYLNYGYGTPLTSPAGDPPKPFPWLTWPNRPFVSQYELLEVPAASSRQLLMSANDLDTDDNPFAMTFTFGSNVATANPYISPKEPFGHLLNFCFSTTFGGTASSANPPTNLGRLLDFVHVPSRFVGTSLQGNPVAFATAGSTTPFQPPFQHIPTYREPGKVNLNTIFDPAVWAGLINYFPDMDATRTVPMFWNQFVASRQGYATPTADETLLMDRYPTRFANPFRSAGGASLVPSTWGSGDPDDLATRIQRDPNATLLRRDPTTGSTRPLFQFDSHAVTESSITPRSGGTDIISDLNEPTWNPAFAYQVLDRLGNLVTTRSNVYAVWITVGYFEVEPHAVDATHPDGFTLAKELGTDTGEIKRHRAFYFLDRSIPVGFQRGQDLNVDKAVLVKRFIE